MAKAGTRATRRGRGRRRFPNLGTYLLVTQDTQAAIAAAVGVSQAQISRILHGQMIPRRALALKLAAHCGIPLESFYTR